MALALIAIFSQDHLQGARLYFLGVGFILLGILWNLIDILVSDLSKKHKLSSFFRVFGAAAAGFAVMEATQLTVTFSYISIARLILFSTACIVGFKEARRVDLAKEPYSKA